MEERGRWAIDTLQRKLKKRVLLQHQRNWDRGWLQYRAQGEAAKLWVGEGDRLLIFVCWHVQVVEHNTRRTVHAQGPAGVDPNLRIRETRPGQKPGGGTSNGRGTCWAGGDTRKGHVGIWCSIGRACAVVLPEPPIPTPHIRLFVCTFPDRFLGPLHCTAFSQTPSPTLTCGCQLYPNAR